MGGYYRVPSAEGERASLGLTPEARTALIARLLSEARADLAAIEATKDSRPGLSQPGQQLPPPR